MKNILSKQDTNFLKGIAILLMLVHHLFFIQNGLYDDVHLYGTRFLVNDIGKLAKVCVAIFVILSGYGLAIGAEKGAVSNLKDFYFHRFKKLFLNYWIIWILFVPVSIFIFDYSLQDAYHNHIIFHLLTDFLGLHAVIYRDINCYNPAWWFYSCIILLYLLFPFIYKWAKKDPLSVFLMSIAISFFPLPMLDVLKYNLIAFVLGIYVVIFNIPAPPSNRLIYFLLSMLSFVMLIFERNFTLESILIDCFISVAMIQLYRSISINKIIFRTFSYIGKHSMNIFLFHSFIFYFWYKDFIYASRNPVIIFLTLLAICLPVSIAIEWFKKYTIYKFIN